MDDRVGEVFEELTAAEFAESIRSGKVQRWNGQHVVGDLELMGVVISRPLVIQKVVFSGDVNFGQARFERSVDLTGCRFEKKLILSDAIVSGTLTLDDVRIGSSPQLAESSPSGEAKGVLRPHVDRTSPRGSGDRLTESVETLSKLDTVAEFNNVHVAGSFSLMNARVFGSFACEYSKIDGGFCLDETYIAGSMSLRDSSFAEVQTDTKTRSCLAQANAAESAVTFFEIGANMDLTCATVEGDVRLIGVAMAAT